MIRISYPILDEACCAIQGFAGAHLVNAIRGAQIFNPVNAAICFAGIALTEKVIYELSNRVIPGSTGFLGPIPIGTKNIVSYGVATYTTFKIMQLVGLIFVVPKAILVIGSVCSGALIIGGAEALIMRVAELL